jgi:alkylation response protein AidB-like acyl-CoA dehydrogenase
MDTPGVEVRPIINMFNVHYFNQIFFENVRVPKANMIGEENRGWYVAAASLDFERSGVSQFAANQRSLEEIVQLARETVINGTALSEDPVFRNRMAELWVANHAGKMAAYNVAWMQSQDLVPNKEASISKLMGSEIAQRIHQLGIQMAGMYGILDRGSKWARLNGRLAWEWMDSISFTLRSGTSEIQRNVIATRGLGLPRD